MKIRFIIIHAKKLINLEAFNMKDFKQNEGASLESTDLYRSASQGDAVAQRKLAEQHLATKDYQAAAVWLSRAAEQGDTQAMVYLADLYDLGRGVPQDQRRSFLLYRDAAAKGDVIGALYLGYCYQAGEGTEQNDAFAAEWFAHAATLGNAEAQRKLGDCYFHGIGVEQSYVEAASWYAEAAAQDDGEAQCNLAECYALGLCVERDMEQAIAWLSCSKGTESGEYRLFREALKKSGQNGNANLRT